MRQTWKFGLIPSEHLIPPGAGERLASIRNREDRLGALLDWEDDQTRCEEQNPDPSGAPVEDLYEGPVINAQNGWCVSD